MNMPRSKPVTMAELRKLAKRKGQEVEIRKEPFGYEEVGLWWEDELTLFATFHAGLETMSACVFAALSALPDKPTKKEKR